MDDDRRNEGYGYPRTFVCAFCKQEFASITSVFSRMSELHEIPHKST
jgi:transcription elongation factor Elf1